MSDEEFREYIGGSLTCRLTNDGSENCGDKFDQFLERCFYQPGQYASEDDFRTLADRLGEVEKVILLLLLCRHSMLILYITLQSSVILQRW